MEQIIKANRLYCFTSEYNKTDDNQRKKILSALIQKLSDTKSSQTNLEKFNLMLNKIEVSQTKKPFYRLNEFQKEKLVKAYVIEKFGDNELYVKEIMKMIINKDITSADIKYNMDEFKLENIKNIELNNNKIILKPKKTSKQKVTEEKAEEKETEEKAEEKETPKKKVKSTIKTENQEVVTENQEVVTENQEVVTENQEVVKEKPKKKVKAPTKK